MVGRGGDIACGCICTWTRSCTARGGCRGGSRTTNQRHLRDAAGLQNQCGVILYTGAKGLEYIRVLGRIEPVPVILCVSEFLGSSSGLTQQFYLPEHVSRESRARHIGCAT